MAEPLSADELMKRASVPVVKSKGAPLFRARTNAAASKTKTMKPKHPNARRKEIEDNNLGLITDFPLLQQQNWDKLSDKDKVVVLDIIGDIKYIEDMDLKVPSMIAEKEKVLAKLKEFLSASSTHIQSLSTYQEFGHKSLESLLEEMDKGLAGESSAIVPSEEDLQIATILKMAGHDVEFTGGKWIYKEEVASVVSYGVELDGKRIFSNDNVNALISYLNYEESAKRDTQHIVPSKLLQVYREVLQQQMTAGEQSKLQMSLTKTFVQEKNQIFSMNSNEYKITRLLDNDTMLRNAQRMAMVTSFESAFGNAPKTKDLTDAMRKSLDAFSVSDSYSRRLKHLDRLIDVVDRNSSAFEEMGPQGGYNVDYIAEYDEQIRRLEAKDPDGQLLVQVRNARDAFLKTVTLQQVFWQSRIKEMIENNENIFGGNLATTLNESMGFAVVQNKGGFNMANGDAIRKFLEQRGKSEIFEELKALVEKGGSEQEVVTYLREKKLVPEAENTPKADNVSGQTQNTKNGSNRKYPEIFLQYLNDIVGMDFEAESNLLLDYSNLRLYQEMWKQDGFFDISLRSFRKDNPEATIDDFIKNFIEEQHSEANFNPELIENAYYLTHKDGASQDKLSKAQAKLDAFNEQLLISDLILAAFTNDELKQYNLLDSKSKTALLQTKNKDALKKLEELKKDNNAYNTALDLAKKRHEAGIVGSVIRRKWISGTKQAEADAKIDPLVSSAIEKFISDLGQEQKDNNQYLISNGEPIVVEGQPQQETQQQSASTDGKNNKKPDPTFGDMYPSGPNVDQFLKRMKPYSAKAVKKNFIDKLLADLDNIKISREAYYARMSSFTSSTDIFEDMTTEEQKKVLDVKNEQQEQQEKPSNAVKITQRDFEASAFMPAAIMFDKIAQNKEEYEITDNISYVFKCLASTDKEMLMGNVVNGKDYRDALRAFAIGLCKHKPEENLEADIKVRTSEVGAILKEYGIEDTEIAGKIRAGFVYITPELLAYAFEPCSTLQDGKLTIGSELPIEQLIACENDAQRRKVVAEKCEMQGSLTLLGELVGKGGIYRDSSGGMDKKAINQGYFSSRQEGKDYKEAPLIASAQLMKLKDAMKAKGMEVPKEIEEAEMGDDGGM